MQIVNRSKMRPDVVKLTDDLLTEQTNGIIEFLSTKENPEFDFTDLFQKMMSENEQFFKKKREGTIDELYGYFTKEEMIFLAKAYRSGFEYAANIEQKKYPIPKNIKVEPIDAGGVSAEWQTAPGAMKDRVILYFHGGGMVLGSPNSHRVFTTTLGQLTKMRVLSVNYRLAPEHPYPAAKEDCMAAYKWLLSTGIKPKNIVIAGDSAGGTLTLLTLLKLRNDGTPLPTGAVCLSPLTDYTGSDESFFENAETDPILADKGVFWWITSYLDGADPSDPSVSPLLADLKGLPPLLFQASTCEMLFSDSKRLVDRAKAAGVKATLQTWDNMVHVFQQFGLHDLPESKEAIDKIVEFIKNLLK
ncbi:MAG: alpha/beta hydrolase [Candidatus Freyarchaeum deiterrae]